MAMSYEAIKHAHMTFAGLSLAGFLLRGWWMWRRSAMLDHRMTRTLPHINDTLLLGAGIWLALTLQQYPLVHGWLTAKLFALLLYILLGTLALKRGRTRRVRILALAGAVATFGYMAAVAIRHEPWPFGA